MQFGKFSSALDVDDEGRVGVNGNSGVAFFCWKIYDFMHWVWA